MAHVVIIGGGMSGMSLAWYLKNLKPDWQLSLLEAEDRPGGKAWTEYRQGFVIERGVNGVLDNKPWTLDLAAELGVRPLRSRKASAKRFIIRNDTLMDLPSSGKAFLSSRLLSLSGKLRLLREVFVRQGNELVDESLEEFATRRLGREAFEYLIDPMASGIYAGNPSRLSLKSCFPRIHELEREYGSLIRAMIRLQIAARRKRRKGPSAGPGGVLTSFREGMGELVDALKQALSDDIKLACKAKVVRRSEGKWLVELEDASVMEASHLVISCPAYAASRLLEKVCPAISEICAHIEYPPIAVVAFGVSKKAMSNNLDGFGFLSPHVEKRRILGALWDSSVFDGRAPQGYHLVRCLIGGMRDRHCLSRTDAELEDWAYKELKELCGLRKPPDFSAVFRWQKAIPQYHVGHEALMERLGQELESQPGLFIRCNWIGGVSLNDCIMHSRRLARQIASGSLKAGF